MQILNIEFKAALPSTETAEEKLKTLAPLFIGTDSQTDTYFNVKAGRLKLREGNIENSLIHYSRADYAGAKQSDVLLYKHDPDKTLKEILIKTLGIKVVVNKIRRIYFIENVKFHFDEVEGLGPFLEVEAIDKDRTIGKEKLQQQCDHYADFFGIKAEDFLSMSYSDMLMEKE